MPRRKVLAKRRQVGPFSRNKLSPLNKVTERRQTPVFVGQPLLFMQKELGYQTIGEKEGIENEHAVEVHMFFVPEGLEEAESVLREDCMVFPRKYQDIHKSYGK